MEPYPFLNPSPGLYNSPTFIPTANSNTVVTIQAVERSERSKRENKIGKEETWERILSGGKRDETSMCWRMRRE